MAEKKKTSAAKDKAETELSALRVKFEANARAYAKTIAEKVRSLCLRSTTLWSRVRLLQPSCVCRFLRCRQDGVIASFMKKLSEARTAEALSEAKAAELQQLLDASAKALVAREAELHALQRSAPPRVPDADAGEPVDPVPPPSPRSPSSSSSVLALAAEVDRLRRDAAVQKDEVTMASHALTAAATEIRDLQVQLKCAAEQAAADDARHGEEVRALLLEVETLQVRATTWSSTPHPPFCDEIVTIRCRMHMWMHCTPTQAQQKAPPARTGGSPAAAPHEGHLQQQQADLAATIAEKRAVEADLKRCREQLVQLRGAVSSRKAYQAPEYADRISGTRLVILVSVV